MSDCVLVVSFSLLTGLDSVLPVALTLGPQVIPLGNICCLPLFLGILYLSTVFPVGLKRLQGTSVQSSIFLNYLPASGCLL